jgi:hypothetical protein
VGVGASLATTALCDASKQQQPSSSSNASSSSPASLTDALRQLFNQQLSDDGDGDASKRDGKGNDARGVGEGGVEDESGGGDELVAAAAAPRPGADAAASSSADAAVSEDGTALACTSSKSSSSAAAADVQALTGAGLMLELAREHWGSLLITVAITVVAALLKMTSMRHMVGALYNSNAVAP